VPPRDGAVARWFEGQAEAYDAWDRGPFAGVREREVRAVTDAVGDVAGAEVLELGCGSGRFTRRLLAAGASRVTAVDLSASMLAQLPQDRVTTVQGDAGVVDVGRTFDHVLSAGMLEFVPDVGAVLANAARHTAIGGRLVLLVPRQSLLGQGYRLWHRGHGVVVRLFGREIGGLVEAAGFRVERVTKVAPFGWVVVARR
jgi:ubiquinone/menaquinone biosynthesis C-methylase UbiE